MNSSRRGREVDALMAALKFTARGEGLLSISVGVSGRAFADNFNFNSMGFVVTKDAVQAGTKSIEIAPRTASH